MATTEKNESPGVTLGAYLPRYEAALLRARAAASRRSVAAEIRAAIKAHLAEDRRD